MNIDSTNEKLPECDVKSKCEKLCALFDNHTTLKESLSRKISMLENEIEQYKRNIIRVEVNFRQGMDGDIIQAVVNDGNFELAEERSKESIKYTPKQDKVIQQLTETTTLKQKQRDELAAVMEALFPSLP